MTPNGLTGWFQTVMKSLCEECKGKQFGIMILRHVVITHMRRKEPSSIAKQQFAQKCLHSTSMNDKYRINKID